MAQRQRGGAAVAKGLVPSCGGTGGERQRSPARPGKVLPLPSVLSGWPLAPRRAPRRAAPRRAPRRAAGERLHSNAPPPPPPEARPGAAGVCLPRTSAGRSSRLTRARRLLACRAGAGAVPLRRAPRALALLCAGGQLCCPPAAPGCVWQSSAVLANVLHWHDWGVDWGAPNPMTQLGAGARRCDPARTPHIYDRSQKAESQSLFETSPTGTNSPRRS